MRAAGGGSTVTRADAVTGRPPERGLTTAEATMVPVDPPVTNPLESTDPSKAPRLWNQRTRTLDISLPALS